MKTRMPLHIPGFVMLVFCLFGIGAVWAADTQVQSGDRNATDNSAILLTIFLKHDQSKTLDQIQAELEKTGFWREFPPEGVAVVSWKVYMGIGQVVTLSVPPAKLREVNRAIERTAWGAFRTEFYPTYDLWPEVQQLKARAKN